MIATLAPGLGGGEGGALAGEAGADDQYVMCWHGRDSWDVLPGLYSRWSVLSGRLG